MKKIQILIGFLIAYNYAFASFKPAVKPYLDLAKPINAINMVMVHDVVAPPVAARYYAYAMMGAYQIVALNNPQLPALNKLVKNFPDLKDQELYKKKYYQIAAVYSIYEIAKMMLPSGYTLTDDEKDYVETLRQGHIKEEDIQAAIAAAQRISLFITAFAQGDFYNKLSAQLRYTPKKTEGSWYPTPPAYMDAVEPNWKTVRPLMIDSSMEFKPYMPVPFSKDPSSKFYQMAKEVRDASVHPSQEEQNIANFWDCNPFAITTSGHMAIGFKKISPGGHWMNIGVLAVKQSGLDLDRSVLTLQVEAIGLMDAFISCWDEKYRSDRIRPETYINRYIDINWKPLLQTPPFPEYTSGHAVISNTAAYILTYLLGPQFKYTDDTEVPFGVSPRKFTSFMQAATEASNSRFYGGIHYKDSIEHGNEEGVAVGTYIVNKLKSLGVKRLL